MRRIVIVIDMQNDFITGSLGTKEAEAVVEPIAKKIAGMCKEDIYATRDTHQLNYLNTSEGSFLPIVHCIEGSEGWKIHSRLQPYIQTSHIFNKPTFGSFDLCAAMKKEAESGPIEIELVGVCTDICVVSNALLLKAALPETPIYVDASCCAGVTPVAHQAALDTMKSCQIQII